jgi:hypothetical protein
MKQIDIHTVIEQMGISSALVEQWMTKHCVQSTISLERVTQSQQSLSPSALAQLVSSASSEQPVFST